MFKGVALALLGRIEEGMAVADRAVREAQERETEPEGLYYTVEARAVIKLLAGTDPGPDAAESFEIAQRIGSPALEQLSQGLLVGAANVRGEWVEAACLAGEALDALGPDFGATGFEIMLGRAVALANLGEAEAVSIAEEAVRIARRGGMRFFEGSALVALLDALRLTDPGRAGADAEQILRRVEGLAAERELVCLFPHVAEQRGELALLGGDEAASRRELARARELFAQIGAGGHAQRVAARRDELAGERAWRP